MFHVFRRILPACKKFSSNCFQTLTVGELSWPVMQQKSKIVVVVVVVVAAAAAAAEQQ